MARCVRRLHSLGDSPDLLWRDPASFADFFFARRNQLGRLCKSDPGFSRRPDNRGDIFPRTSSRGSLENWSPVYVDLYNVGVAFRRPFLESARANVAARDLDLRLQFNRARLRSI